MFGAVIMAAPVLAADSDATKPAASQKPAMTAPKKVAKKHKKAPASCASLERQLDSAIKRHAKSANIENAKKMREEGHAACTAKDQKGGMAKLQQGLKELGVKPKA